MIVIVPCFLNRYFQSRPEIFANLADGSQATPAVSAAMNRASDVTSKMVMGGLRHAVASKTGGGGGNANTTVSSFLYGSPWGGQGGGEVKGHVQSFFFVAIFCCSRSDVILFWLIPSVMLL